ncbi:hypothetical protein [Geomicrobium sp. JCM 19038]|uniref:hypothetical protein n=1 Tax=Geomicrobium sp. JCM 19038 TaxID=1460635 RepID=UPI00045F41EA|nr:hypothetical protein [Geomicrobium sp. JCM 19038]GAK06849.1 hypothetical protein JCM19038_559 [Geomicrobium sp. JCM 19038]
MSNKKDELYKDLTQLRTKQIVDTLSHAEKQKLQAVIYDVEQQLEKQHKKKFDLHQLQEESWVKIHAFRNFSFEDVTPKKTFMDVLLSRPQFLYYSVNVEEEDWEVNSLQFSDTMMLKTMFEKDGIVFSEVLPGFMDYFDSNQVTKEEKEQMERLPDPKWCLLKVDEMVELDETLKSTNIELHDMVLWLKEMWHKDYQLFIEYDEALTITIS